ncbi:hypothetical protein DFH07DRAFT_1055113, partial [Mycena maculata]
MATPCNIPPSRLIPCSGAPEAVLVACRHLSDGTPKIDIFSHGNSILLPCSGVSEAVLIARRCLSDGTPEIDVLVMATQCIPEFSSVPNAPLIARRCLSDVSPSRLPGSSGAPEAALIARLHPSSGYPQNRPFSYVNCRFIGLLGAPIVARLHPSGGNPEIDFLTMIPPRSSPGFLPRLTPHSLPAVIILMAPPKVASSSMSTAGSSLMPRSGFWCARGCPCRLLPSFAWIPPKSIFRPCQLQTPPRVSPGFLARSRARLSTASILQVDSPKIDLLHRIPPRPSPGFPPRQTLRSLPAIRWPSAKSEFCTLSW